MKVTVRTQQLFRFGILVIILAISNLAKAQYAYIPDPEFRNFLYSNYGLCMNGDSLNTSCPLLQPPTTLNITVAQQMLLQDITGVQYFPNVTTLTCTGSGISTLPPLPPNLVTLNVSNNPNFNLLPIIPNSVETLTVSNNFNLTALGTLPASLKILNANNCNIASVSGFPSSMIRINLDYNNLNSIPALPSGLERLYCSFNNLTALPALPATLQHLQVNNNALTALPALNNGLFTLECNGNQLTALPALPSTLVVLVCAQNQLTALPTIPSSLLTLNASLNQITSISSFGNVSNFTISYNLLTSLPPIPGNLGMVLYCNNNQISTIGTIADVPNGLTALYAHNNQLSCLPALPQSLIILEALNGNSLTCLPNLPSSLTTNDCSGLPICSGSNGSGCFFFPQYIKGKSYHDANSNCVFDAGDAPLPNRIIQVGTTNYTMTDANGDYQINLDTGSYSVNQIINSNLWDFNCTGIPYNIHLDPGDSIVNLDFANDATVVCPWPTVDIASALQRKCFTTNQYIVNYCNNGTMEANGAYIEIVFPPEIIPLSSTLPWSSVNGGTYTFNLGNLAIGQCGSFVITDSVSCSAMIGQSVCATATIYPQTCVFPGSGWDNSSLAVTGKCINDTINFKIKNNGSGNMLTASNYIIYEDNVLMMTAPIQLNSNDSLIIQVPATGKTYRMDAEQSTGHPGMSFPRCIIELCGDPVYSLGHVTTVSQDDVDDFVEINCNEVIVSYDPNDKTVQPAGVTMNHYILAEDQLEYLIRFQNTGNDTAFNILVKDTIDVSRLNLNTIIPGVSSHPYTMTIRDNVIDFWFPNILLPDSNVNEPGSHGFVKFKIHQQPGNAPGSVIENKADIYFDYNAPVITDVAFVTIQTWEFIFSTTYVHANDKLRINAYPNPFMQWINFSLESSNDYKSLQFELYDLTGQMVMQTTPQHMTFMIDGGHLSCGMYFFVLKDGGKTICTGKIIKQ